MFPVKLAFDPGPCRALIPRWSFDAVAQACSLKSWGGCQGNGNNFLTRAECELSCRGCDAECGPHQECRIDPGCKGEVCDPYCADTCRGNPCAQGDRCELVPVDCVTSPCPPVAICLPEHSACESSECDCVGAGHIETSGCSARICRIEVGYEIELSSSAEFYVGALSWLLNVGDWSTARSRSASDFENRKIVFPLSDEEFDSLQVGEELTAQYGFHGGGLLLDLGDPGEASSASELPGMRARSCGTLLKP
jgi:hypothetical protein